jgi:hypothetical protein
VKRAASGPSRDRDGTANQDFCAQRVTSFSCSERAVRGYFRPGQRQSGPVIQSKSSYFKFAIRISGHTAAAIGAAFVAF